MQAMNHFRFFCSKARCILQAHAPELLTFMGATGVAAVSVMSGKAALKSEKVLRERSQKKGTPLTIPEKVRTILPIYIPVTLMSASTIACVFSANILSRRQQNTLTGAYALINQSYQMYKNKVKEICGEDTHQSIIDSIAREKVSNTHIFCPGCCQNSTLDFEDNDPEANRLFYDVYSGRYFETSIDKVIQAEYHINRNFILRGDTSLNEFYDFLGLLPIEYGDNVGWNSCNGDLFWIDFNHYKTTLEDGLEVYMIEMLFEPWIDFDKD